MRFTVAYPHNGLLPYFFHENMMQLLMKELTRPEKDEVLIGSMIESNSCHVPFNRNNICLFFLTKSTDDFVVMIDPDVGFTTDLLTKFANLITTYGAKFPYWDRENYPHIISARVDIGNGLPVFYKRIYPGEFRQDPRPFSGLKHFDMVGSGIIAISRYCLNVLNREANTHHYFSHREEHGRLMSDDFSFCQLAEKHGFKPYGAWDIRGVHHKPMPIMPHYLELVEEFEAFKRDRPTELPKWLTDEHYKYHETKPVEEVEVPNKIEEKKDDQIKS